MLTDRYLDGIPSDSRAAKAHGFLQEEEITPARLSQIRQLAELATSRGQSLAQMALAWVLRDARITTVLIGASSVAQLEQNLGCLANRDFTPGELATIEEVLVQN